MLEALAMDLRLGYVDLGLWRRERVGLVFKTRSLAFFLMFKGG